MKLPNGPNPNPNPDYLPGLINIISLFLPSISNDALPSSTWRQMEVGRVSDRCLTCLTQSTKARIHTAVGFMGGKSTIEYLLGCSHQTGSLFHQTAPCFPSQHLKSIRYMSKIGARSPCDACFGPSTSVPEGEPLVVCLHVAANLHSEGCLPRLHADGLRTPQMGDPPQVNLVNGSTRVS